MIWYLNVLQFLVPWFQGIYPDFRVSDPDFRVHTLKSGKSTNGYIVLVFITYTICSSHYMLNTCVHHILIHVFITCVCVHHIQVSIKYVHHIHVFITYVCSSHMCVHHIFVFIMYMCLLYSFDPHMTLSPTCFPYL